MAAIITDDFRRNQARLLVRDIKASTISGDAQRENETYGIGIGKTDSWPADTNGASEDAVGFAVSAPTGSEIEALDVINNISSIKELDANGAIQCIARNNWTSGRKYKVYDKTDPNTYYATGDLFPSYVISGGSTYVCLSNSSNDGSADAIGTSTVTPAGGAGTVDHNSDGYTWAHAQTLPTSGANLKFITSQFVPVTEPTGSETNTEQVGLLYGIGITNAGTGYSGTPTATISAIDVNGNAISVSGIELEVIKSGTTISSINLAKAGETGSVGYYESNSVYLKNVRYATVTITGGSGSGATAAALIAPADGFGRNATKCLPTFFVGISAQFENTEGSDAKLNPFRQISLIKDYVRTNDSDGTVDSLDGLKFFSYTASSAQEAKIAALVAGDVLTQATSGSKFYFDAVDTSANKIFYHQNTRSEVNFIKPDAITANITVTSTSASSGVSNNDTIATAAASISEGEYKHRASDGNPNGQVIFHENRAPFVRASTQTEEVKLIIQL